MLDKILENQVQQHKQTNTPQANEAYSGNASLFSIFFFLIDIIPQTKEGKPHGHIKWHRKNI